MFVNCTFFCQHDTYITTHNDNYFFGYNKIKYYYSPPSVDIDRVLILFSYPPLHHGQILPVGPW